MELTDLIFAFKDTNVDFYENYEISKINSFEIGNVAKLVAFPNDIDAFIEISTCLYQSNIKYCIVGKGTNILFSDQFYNGVIISTERLNEISIKNDILVAMCGATVTDCALFALENCFGGLEFYCGIPGSVGGAVFMNAGAFDSKTSDVLLRSLVLDLKSKTVFSMEYEDHRFAEKTSVFTDNKSLVILSTEFKLLHSYNIEFYLKAIRYVSKRIRSQPLDLGSAGSSFKRPINAYASKLIDDAKLKGLKIGGAEISSKHAGFIVNYNNATSEDVLRLIEIIRKKVFDEFHVTLDEEILFIE